MKKVFISVPMKGRTNEVITESIEKMKQFAEVILGEEVEVIHNFYEHPVPENVNESIYCLGKAIEKMAFADFFIGLDYCGCFRGCYVEREVASAYGIPSYYIHMHNVKWLEDAVKIDNESSGYLSTNCTAEY